MLLFNVFVSVIMLFLKEAVEIGNGGGGMCICGHNDSAIR